MKVVIQRVNEASVTIKGEIRSSIDKGLLILLGITDQDGQEDIFWLINKIINLRIFEDNDGVMNRSLLDIDGECLVVSQFTLHAKTKNGNRPSYVEAAAPAIAIPIYDLFIKELQNKMSTVVKSGEFGAHMNVRLINDGPVTIIIDSKNKV